MYVCSINTTHAQWSITGNSNATGTSKLGTTNLQPLRLYTNNTNWLYITPTGRFGISSNSTALSAPTCKFQIETQVGLSGLCVKTNQNAVDNTAFNIISMVNNSWERAYAVQDYVSNATRFAIFGDGRTAIGGATADEALHVYGNAKITGNIVSEAMLTAKDEMRVKNTAGEFVSVFMRKNTAGDKKIMLFGDQTIPSQLNTTANCFNNPSGIAYVVYDGIYARSWQNANNILRLTHDGNHGIIESGTNAPVTPGIQGLLLNYYCGEDVGICVGPNGGKVALNTTEIFGQGLSVKQSAAAINKAAIEVLDASSNINFMVKSNGETFARKLTVSIYTFPFPDYVFEKEYKLMSLPELETYINKNKHLPEIPSANEVIEKGIDVGEMNTLLLKKVEELTLHVIDLQKQINKLQK